eukprot:TRINITY_DN10411_c0_g2_i2.p1 TRINITY_DN10411_c0_g2~~TRINITY_DN10411_c0_g2_i2.p1  ORF type:complete len:655 (+),score=77.62 TRINITY_DN10411_c0_g2_i2:327-2291(+)
MPEHKAQSISELIAMYFNPNQTMDMDAGLVAKIEQLFSDEHLLTDVQMLIEIKKHNGTFVSLAFLLSHEEVRKLNVDKQRLSSVLRMHSKLLELNKDGSMVRRIEPVTDIALEPLVARSVLVENLPELLASSQTLTNLFSHFGSKVTVNVYHPQQSKKAINLVGVSNQVGIGLSQQQNMNMLQTPHAVVLFETQSEADKMVQLMNEENDKRFGLTVSKLPLPKLPVLNNSGKKFVRMVLLLKQDGTVGVELYMVQGQNAMGQHIAGSGSIGATVLSHRPNITSPRMPQVPGVDLLSKHQQQSSLRRDGSSQLNSLLHATTPFMQQPHVQRGVLPRSISSSAAPYYDLMNNYGFDTINKHQQQFASFNGNGSAGGFTSPAAISRGASQQLILQQQQQQLLQQQMQQLAVQSALASPSSSQALLHSQQSAQWQQHHQNVVTPSTQTYPQLNTVRRSVSTGSAGNVLHSMVANPPLPSSLSPIDSQSQLFTRSSSISEHSPFQDMLNAWGSATNNSVVPSQPQKTIVQEQQQYNIPSSTSAWNSVPSGFQSVQVRNHRQQTRRDYASWAAATPEMRAVAQAKYAGPPQEDRKVSSMDLGNWIPQSTQRTSSSSLSPHARPTFASRGDSAETQVRIAKMPDGTRGFAAGRGRSLSTGI